MTFCKLWLMELFLRRLVIYQFVVRRYRKRRLCQNVGTTSFIFYSSAIFSFGYAAFSSCIWQQVAIFQLYRVINSPINIYLATVMSPFPSFVSLAHIFLILKAIAKKAKSIVTLFLPHAGIFCMPCCISFVQTQPLVLYTSCLYA